MTLYLPALLRKELHLAPGTKADMVGRVEWGRLVLEVRPRTGVGPEDLLNLARKKGWKVEEERLTDPQSWFLLLRAPWGALRADGWTHTGPRFLNNVLLATDPLRIRDLKEYEQLHSLAQEHRLELSLADSEGLWTRVQFAPGSGEALDRAEAVSRLLTVAREVTARFQIAWRSTATRVMEMEAGADRARQAFDGARGLVKPLPG